ncbi:hypothetical protein CFP65_0879 [Kitasatospora sp. MMS16-BH015]|uniref:hypothetical protein n=1 Tax=Kitasatospora sp. MMS16-BH015 TaxID=2018025 RepID=UPI000CA1A014|nr:hypothetical protein [Kitasatospora sp. MMS16-BH015]AUG75804.1 hypothetical protein CFP65_0879 [Kitasatospora sp. MMS16-BH015]
MFSPGPSHTPAPSRAGLSAGIDRATARRPAWRARTVRRTAEASSTLADWNRGQARIAEQFARRLVSEVLGR